MSVPHVSFLRGPVVSEAEAEPRDHSFFEDRFGATSISDDTSSSDASDPGPPYLIVDLYPHALGPNPPWPVLVSTAGYVGAIIKAMEGIDYRDSGWFNANWPAVRHAGGDRYGDTWFRGAYLFLRFAVPGADQADAYLRTVDGAGGWDMGDILPIIDVELGSETNPNRSASAQQVIDCTTACADRLREQTGRGAMLYGRGAMRDLSINDRMGCDVVWNPASTSSMVRNGLDAWELDDIALWQYCEDGVATFPKLPHSVPGFGHGKVDISVYLQSAEKPTLQRLRERLID